MCKYFIVCAYSTIIINLTINYMFALKSGKLKHTHILDLM